MELYSLKSFLTRLLGLQKIMFVCGNVWKNKRWLVSFYYYYYGFNFFSYIFGTKQKQTQSMNKKAPI